MSSRALLLVSSLAFIVGGSAAWTGFQGLAEPIAEARLVVTVTANPTPETFAGIVGGAENIAATLAELASFDTFRAEVLGGGFGISPDLFRGSAEEMKAEWNRRVRVDRLNNTLVVRVRARGRAPDEARALAGTVLHTLALRAPAVVGNHVVHVTLERLPTLVFPLTDLRVSYALMGGGAAGMVLGFATLGFVIVERRKSLRLGRATGNREKPEPAVSATPSPPAASAPVSSTDARYWLQKFLEEHQRVPRKSADTITTWEDFPESSRDARWLKPPVALAEEKPPRDRAIS